MAGGGSLSALDQRHSAGSSPWHWGEGLQHERIPDVGALDADLADSGLVGMEIVDPRADANFAQTAAALFDRDGFVLVKALEPEQVASLHSRVE